MEEQSSVLIVDDEKNIRLTLSHSLKPMGFDTETAITGEEALEKIENKEFKLVLLDIKLPGIDGIEVLRKIRQSRPDIAVIIITAHGTIESAVEAMKLGAIDFLQKPFTPGEIRDLVTKIMERKSLDESNPADYDIFIELAKKSINERHFDAAASHLKKAISLNPSNPDAFNFLGLLYEVQGNILDAQKKYRAALALDPTFAPARKNLDRVTEYRDNRTIRE